MADKLATAADFEDDQEPLPRKIIKDSKKRKIEIEALFSSSFNFLGLVCPITRKLVLGKSLGMSLESGESFYLRGISRNVCESVKSLNIVNKLPKDCRGDEISIDNFSAEDSYLIWREIMLLSKMLDPGKDLLTGYNNALSKSREILIKIQESFDQVLDDHFGTFFDSFYTYSHNLSDDYLNQEKFKV